MCQQKRLSICYLNNEWIGYVMKLRRRREITSQMGFGIVELMARRTRVVWRLPKKQRDLAGRWYSPRFGNWFQQWKAVSLLGRYDAVYSANTDTMGMLAMLRSVGLFPKPIVALLHTPFVTNTFQGRLRAKRVLVGLDRVLCYTPSLLKHMQEKFPEYASKMLDSGIGPDLPMYPKWQSGGNYFVASGITGRDYAVLARAFQNLPYRCRVHPGRPSLNEKFSPNVELSLGDGKCEKLLDDLSRAMALIVPIRKECCTVSTHGVSSFFDALGIGIPCIVARSPWLIDVEKEGVGLWYEPGDERSLRDAITKLASDEGLRTAMSERARNLAMTRNMDALGENIFRSLCEVSGYR